MAQPGTIKKLIEGLRLLPWVHGKRSERLNGDYMDCTQCLARPEQRKIMACGWISELDRGSFAAPSAWPRDVSYDICPGYLVQLPQVIETARLYGWRKDGSLTEGLCGRKMTLLARDCLDILASSTGQYEIHSLEEARNGTR